MDRAEMLLQAYAAQLTMPWREGLSGAERIWIAVYPPEAERRVRARVPEFELVTKGVGRAWVLHDLTTAFSTWMAAHPRREAYFANPELITPALSQLGVTVEESIRTTLTSQLAGPTSVVALLGAAALFPMVRISDLLRRVAPAVQGRLLVFFPGAYEDGNYRLLDARDGWNYLAIPITIPQGATS